MRSSIELLLDKLQSTNGLPMLDPSNVSMNMLQVVYKNKTEVHKTETMYLSDEAVSTYSPKPSMGVNNTTEMKGDDIIYIDTDTSLNTPDLRQKIDSCAPAAAESSESSHICIVKKGIEHNRDKSRAVLEGVPVDSIPKAIIQSDDISEDIISSSLDITHGSPSLSKHKMKTLKKKQRKPRRNLSRRTTLTPSPDVLASSKSLDQTHIVVKEQRASKMDIDECISCKRVESDAHCQGPHSVLLDEHHMTINEATYAVDNGEARHSPVAALHEGITLLGEGVTTGKSIVFDSTVPPLHDGATLQPSTPHTADMADGDGFSLTGHVAKDMSAPSISTTVVNNLSPITKTNGSDKVQRARSKEKPSDGQVCGSTNGAKNGNLVKHPVISRADRSLSPLDDKTLAKKMIQLELDTHSCLYTPAKNLCTALFKLITRLHTGMSRWGTLTATGEFLDRPFKEHLHQLFSYRQVFGPDPWQQSMPFCENFEQKQWSDIEIFNSHLALLMTHSSPTRFKDFIIHFVLTTYSSAIDHANVVRDLIVSDATSGSEDDSSQLQLIVNDDPVSIALGITECFAVFARRCLTRLSVSVVRHHPDCTKKLIKAITSSDGLDPDALLNLIHHRRRDTGAGALRRKGDRNLHKASKQRALDALRNELSSYHHAFKEFELTLHQGTSLEFCQLLTSMIEKNSPVWRVNLPDWESILKGHSFVEVIQDCLPQSIKEALHEPILYEEMQDTFETALAYVLHNFSFYLLRVQILVTFVTDAGADLLTADIYHASHIAKKSILAVSKFMYIAVYIYNLDVQLDMFSDAAHNVLQGIDGMVLSNTTASLRQEMIDSVEVPPYATDIEKQVSDLIDATITTNVMAVLLDSTKHALALPDPS